MPPAREELNGLLRRYGTAEWQAGRRAGRHLDGHGRDAVLAALDHANEIDAKIDSALDSLYAELDTLRAVFGDLCNDSPAARAAYNLGVDACLAVLASFYPDGNGNLAERMRSARKE